MAKMTYDEWKSKYHCTFADGVIETLRMLHNVDAEKEADRLIMLEYETYLSTEKYETHLSTEEV